MNWFRSSYPEQRPAQIEGQSFDYIVVGGGTAGCVVASRLSENPNVSVLVLEKGHVKDNMISRIPIASQNMWMGDSLQVQSTRWTEPIPGASGRKNRLWGAEGIGGSSRLNAMLWTRGSPAEYNSWSDMGLSDWKWEKVEPYFRKLENAISHSASKFRGHQGPVDLRQQSFPFTWTSFIKKAVLNTGLPVNEDYNDPKSPSTCYTTFDVALNSRGERVSSFNAFLNKAIALKRQNHLTICTGAVVSRLDISSGNGTVNGVYIKRSHDDNESDDGILIKANREVIICSGALCTPQLLLLSGIGPAHSAQHLGIPLAKELPVGQTFSDHWSVPIMAELPKKETIHILESVWSVWYFIIWLISGSGLLGTTSALNSIFLNSKAIEKETMSIKTIKDSRDDATSDLVPDIEIIVMPINSLERHVPGHSLFSLYPTIIQPRSMGRVELVDKNPLTNPRIIHPMFTNDEDRATLRIAVRFTMRLFDEFRKSGYPYPSPYAFAPGHNPDLFSQWERASGPNDLLPAINVSKAENKPWKDITDKEIDNYMSRVAHTSLHYCCTCPMSADARLGVVDQQLRVHGIRNLRIADASVFPRVPSVHTMAPVMMVAERCAGFIQDTWEKD